jgi:transcriptional regulator with XRE-family HTH domain
VETLCERLKRLREEKPISVVALARETHISPSLIRYYERAYCMPTFWTLVELARFFNVSLDYFMCMTNDRKEFPHDYVAKHTPHDCA